MSPANGDQAAAFAFTFENAERARAIIDRYPPGRQASAVVPLLDLAQRQNGGWLSQSALDCIADMLDMPRIRVYEVASFYTMLNTRSVGRNLVQVCTTTPCWLRDSDTVLATCREMLGIDVGETTEDGLFTLVEVECLGACCNAPMMQINDDYYEDLDRESTISVLDALKRGERPKPGSQIGRQTSEPVDGPTTLVTPSPTQEP